MGHINADVVVSVYCLISPWIVENIEDSMVGGRRNSNGHDYEETGPITKRSDSSSKNKIPCSRSEPDDLTIDFALRIYRLCLTHSNSTHLIKFKQLAQIFGILCYGEADQKLRLLFRLFLDENEPEVESLASPTSKSSGTAEISNSSTIEENLDEATEDQDKNSSSSEDSESGWAGEKVRPSDSTSNFSSQIASPAITPTKTITTAKLESEQIDLSNNASIKKMKLPQFINLTKTLYGFCRGEENESVLYRNLSEMCNLLVDMGSLESNENESGFTTTFTDSINKNLEEQCSLDDEEAKMAKEAIESMDDQDEQGGGTTPTTPSSVKSQSVSNIIKVRLEEEEKNKNLWRVSVVQFLAAVHSEETLQNWFGKPRCLYDRFGRS